MMDGNRRLASSSSRPSPDDRSKYRRGHKPEMIRESSSVVQLCPHTHKSLTECHFLRDKPKMFPQKQIASDVSLRPENWLSRPRASMAFKSRMTASPI